LRDSALKMNAMSQECDNAQTVFSQRVEGSEGTI
jgi:hypothetical protein